MKPRRLLIVTAAFLGSAALPLGFGWQDEKNFGQWQTPVRLESPVNSPDNENGPSISKDGLTLYFCRAAKGLQDWEIMVSTRASADEPWGVPSYVTAVNSPYADGAPKLSLDEHRLYFASSRPSSCGGAAGTYDLWVSRRQDRRDNFGWEPPINLGCESDGFVNTPDFEVSPTPFEDESGQLVLYYQKMFRVPPTNRVEVDIYQTRQRSNDSFGPGTPVAELNTPYSETASAIRRDGLEIVLVSNRPGSQGEDLWSAARGSTADAWSPLVRLINLSSPFADGGGQMSMSFDGRALYFASNRDSAYGMDIYVSTREKLRGKKP